MLEVRLLGQFGLRRDDAAVLLPSRPAQSLLAYLVLSAGAAHRREKLAGLLWPDADEDNARSNLRHALWRIRKAIESDQAATPYLLADELAVSFNAGANYWLDAAILTRGSNTLQDLTESVAAYRGELLPGLYDDWITLERERLEALFQDKMQRLLDRLVEDHDWAGVLEWGERWVALGHAPEPGYRALMRAHAESGDRARVAAVYQRCREALFNELGVEPSPVTRRLYQQLCRDDAEPGDAPGALAPTTEWAGSDDPRAPGEPPFQGLRCFDEADADRFFGREGLAARLVGRLRSEPFLAVLGASGSGKSSVVRAGLVPALRRAQRSNDGNGRSAGDFNSDVRVLTPTAHPLEALAVSLLPKTTNDGLGEDRALVLDELSRDSRGLWRWLTQRVRPGRRAVLVVDQFEELFTLCHDNFEREAFAENLLGAAEPDGPAAVVIALRADFYAHCAPYASLREAVAQHQEYVGPMTLAELRRAIQEPAHQSGWELEPGLVDLLLRDVGEEPGGLPLLSHALLETWNRRRGWRLTLAAYTASGGVHGAIAQTAETVFGQQLTPEQQAIGRRVFLNLTELGEGTQDTRRRATIDDLVGRPNSAAEVSAVLELLADARLITLGPGTAEVAHEALIREWPRLREWLTQDRESLRLQRQLLRAAREWERLGRDAGGLYRGAQLAQALGWAGEHRAELGELEGTFLVASTGAAEQEAAEREAQRERELEAARQLADAEQRRADEQRRSAGQLRLRAVLLGVAFSVAMVMAGAALFFGDRARQEARTAVARELSAAAIGNLSIDPERAALLALQAVDTSYAVDRTWTPDAEDALHRVAPLLRAELRLTGHSGRVLAVVFSPDGHRLATASQDGTARVWDAMSGQQQLTLRGHTGAVNAVAFSPDGRLIATAGDDRTARVWDASSGQEFSILSGHGQEVERWRSARTEPNWPPPAPTGRSGSGSLQAGRLCSLFAPRQPECSACTPARSQCRPPSRRHPPLHSVQTALIWRPRRNTDRSPSGICRRHHHGHSRCGRPCSASLSPVSPSARTAHELRPGRTMVSRSGGR
ncbi:MAG TPA: BTAD domain-containing putative transcriptional regulator [Chloroflexota bacterium]|nr:BTAD domain-containing putative transcriptional regulator [Chloroflexota bacterium]